MHKKLIYLFMALVLALSLCLVTAAPAAAVTGDVEFITDGGTAAWSAVTSHSGSYSVLLTAAYPDSASVGVQVIPTPLADITQLSFWYNHKVCTPAAGHVLGPDMVLILQNGAQYYVAGRGGAVASVSAWSTADPIAGTNFAPSSTWFYGSLTGTDIRTFTPIGGGLAFSALQTALSGATVLYAAVNLDPPADSSGSVYVDDITVNNTPYNLEPAGDTNGSGTVPNVQITSTDIAGPYVVGIEKGFSVKTTSDTTFSLVRFNFVAAGAVPTDIASFKYEAGGTWYSMPLTQVGDNLEGYFGPPGGFVMAAPYDVTTPFKVTFSTAKTYPVTVSLVNMPDSSPLIKSVAFSLVVAERPSTIEIGAPSNFSFGVFHIGDNLAASAVAGIVTYAPGSAATGWQVTAKDANQVTNSGYMLKGTTPLATELLIGVGYEPASTGINYTGGVSDVTGTLPFQAKQVIAGTEAPGAYTITIEFTGTVLGF